jgi:signal peptidase II
VKQAARNRRSWLVLVAGALVVFSADQATKAVVRSTLAVGDRVETVGPFSINHVRNSGIVGGYLEGSAVPLVVVGALCVAGLLLYFARRRAGQAAVAAGIGLLVGGTLGNLVDRARLGYVTDFIRRADGGAFNVADLGIFLGVALLLVLLWRIRPPAGRSERVERTQVDQA